MANIIGNEKHYDAYRFLAADLNYLLSDNIDFYKNHRILCLWTEKEFARHLFSDPIDFFLPN